MSDLINDVYTVREVFDECSIEINTVALLLDIQVVVGKVEIVHPVILSSTCFKHRKDSSRVITLRD